MAINTIEAAKIFQTALDQQVLEEATTGWMEDNAGQVKYSGGAVAMIPKVSMSGLGNYDRNSDDEKKMNLIPKMIKMTVIRKRSPPNHSEMIIIFVILK